MARVLSKMRNVRAVYGTSRRQVARNPRYSAPTPASDTICHRSPATSRPAHGARTRAARCACAAGAGQRCLSYGSHKTCVSAWIAHHAHTEKFPRQEDEQTAKLRQRTAYHRTCAATAVIKYRVRHPGAQRKSVSAELFSKRRRHKTGKRTVSSADRPNT